MASHIKVVAQNRKARHDFFIEEVYEAGIELKGTEVKSIRAGKMNLKDGYAKVENGEVFLYNVHVSPYEQGNIFNVEPRRVRRLLLHKREIRKLIGYTQQQGYTLIPLRAYLKDGKVKLEMAVARGKVKYDKRAEMAKRDANRRIQQELGRQKKQSS